MYGEYFRMSSFFEGSEYANRKPQALRLRPRQGARAPGARRLPAPGRDPRQTSAWGASATGCAACVFTRSDSDDVLVNERGEKSQLHRHLRQQGAGAPPHRDAAGIPPRRRGHAAAPAGARHRLRARSGAQVRDDGDEPHHGLLPRSRASTCTPNSRTRPTTTTSGASAPPRSTNWCASTNTTWTPRSAARPCTASTRSCTTRPSTSRSGARPTSASCSGTTCVSPSSGRRGASSSSTITWCTGSTRSAARRSRRPCAAARPLPLDPVLDKDFYGIRAKAAAAAAAAAASAVAPMTPLLEIDNLQVGFDTEAGLLRAVDGVSMSVAAGQTLGAGGRVGLRQERHRGVGAAPGAEPAGRDAGRAPSASTARTS